MAKAMDKAQVIDAVDDMIKYYGIELVSTLFNQYHHDPGLVAFALTVGHRGAYHTIEAFADEYVLGEGWLLDIPEDVEDFFDAESYAKKHLLTGPTRMFDCLFDGSQHHFFDKDLLDGGVSVAQAADAFAEIESNADELPMTDFLDGPSLPAQMVASGEQLKAMNYDELTTWLQAYDTGLDLSDTQVKRNLSAFLGIDVVAMRGTDWLTPDHLIEWRDPDVPDILYAQYGPLVDTAAAILTKEEDIEKRIYLLAEGADGVYDNALDMVIALNTGQHVTGKTWPAGLGQTMQTMARHAANSGWDSTAAPYYAASYPDVLSTIGPNDPMYPVTMINKDKVNAATHEDCIKAAEKALAKIRSKERSKGNAR